MKQHNHMSLQVPKQAEGMQSYQYKPRSGCHSHPTCLDLDCFYDGRMFLLKMPPSLQLQDPQPFLSISHHAHCWVTYALFLVPL